MATYTVSRAKHATLSPGVVDSVTFTANPGVVEVMNRGTSAYLFFSVDGSTPAVGSDDTYVVGPGGALRVDLTLADNVRLVSAAACDYSATGV